MEAREGVKMCIEDLKSHIMALEEELNTIYRRHPFVANKVLSGEIDLIIDCLKNNPDIVAEFIESVKSRVFRVAEVSDDQELSDRIMGNFDGLDKLDLVELKIWMRINKRLRKILGTQILLRKFMDEISDGT